jgi:hypothetical protein
MLRISGIVVHGLNTEELEKLLTKELKSVARVIGVTGQSIDMDIYGLDEENIMRDEKNLIKAVALADGITLTDLASIACSGKTTAVNAANFPERSGHCAGERWKRGA